MRNLTRRWRRPEMKNMIARITIIRRSVGLILLTDDDGDGVDPFS